MLRKSSFIVLILLAWCNFAVAQSVIGSGVYGDAKVSGGGGGYVGPGDVYSGGKVFYSCGRGYDSTSASSGAKACNVCNITGGVVIACQDMFVGSSGKVVISSISGVSCSTGGIICGVNTWYDMSRALACSGAPCDQTASSVASVMAVLNLSALGGLACATFSTGTVYTPVTFSGLSQSFTGSFVARNNISSPGGLMGDAGAVGFFDNGGNWGFFASTNVSDGASDTTTFHSFQMVANSTSSSVTVDSSTTGSLNAGTSAFGTTIRWGSDAYSRWVGLACEGGLWPGSVNLTSNQHSSTNGYNF
jgi:hypothetical protein